MARRSPQSSLSNYAGLRCCHASVCEVRWVLVWSGWGDFRGFQDTYPGLTRASPARGQRPKGVVWSGTILGGAPDAQDGHCVSADNPIDDDVGLHRDQFACFRLTSASTL